MSAFKFYDVNKDYVDFLRKAESKIPNISYNTNDKFVCGILFSMNGMDYFAPISSFDKQQRTNILIKNRSGRVTSSIRFSFMFPAPMEMLTVKNFAKENPFYKRLLMEELDFCSRNSDKIINTANYIYKAVTVDKDALMCKNCCDFKKLEAQYLLYQAQEQSKLQGRPVHIADRLAAAKQEAAKQQEPQNRSQHKQQLEK